MKLYEIDRALEEALEQVDEETGEVLFDPEALEALLMERERKLEGMALAWKNLTAEAAAIRVEEKALVERRQKLERGAERLKDYLQGCLAGEALKTARVAVSYRRIKAVEVTDETKLINWARIKDRYDLLRLKTPEIDKAAVKSSIQGGEAIPGAELVERVNMTIK